MTAPATLEAAAGPMVRAGRLGGRYAFWRRFLRHTGALTGGCLLALLVGMAVFAPWVAPFDPLAVNPLRILEPPAWPNLFGTDTVGRDLLSRVIHGARYSLWLGFVSVAISLTLGTTLGVLAGYRGGWTDTLISRLIDVLLAFPGLLLTMLAIFTLGPSLVNAMIAIGVAGSPSFARVVRAEVLAAREHLYVDAARTIGARDGAIMFRHILPNVIAPAIVISTLRIGTAVIYGASLSYLGLGAQAPAPEWGLLLNQGRSFMSVAWWLSFFPGLAVMTTVLATNLLGDGLRDLLDPRLRRG